MSARNFPTAQEMLAHLGGDNTAWAWIDDGCEDRLVELRLSGTRIQWCDGRDWHGVVGHGKPLDVRFLEWAMSSRQIRARIRDALRTAAEIAEAAPTGKEAARRIKKAARGGTVYLPISAPPK